VTGKLSVHQRDSQEQVDRTQRKASLMSREERHYLSYLLRLWQVRSEGELVWRASLESAHTGERQGFANLDDLFDFLQKQTATVLDANGGQNEAERGGDESATEYDFQACLGCD